MNFQELLRQRFEVALQGLTPQAAHYASMVKRSQDPKFGDYQANCAMPLVKELNRKNPRELAGEIISRLQWQDLCHPPEIAGPGFINLKLRDEVLVAHVESLTKDARLGVGGIPARKYIVDFSAPNVAKPMHVGHLRSTVIGESLCRILRFVGHTVVGDNHIGDWGTQFGMIIYGYKNFLDQGAFQRDMVGELARLYRLVNQLSDYHDGRNELVKLDPLLSEKLRKLAEPADKETAPELLEKQRKKLRIEVEEIRQKIGSLRSKQQQVEQDPTLAQYAAEHPLIARDARLETSKLHAGDAENRRLWEAFVPACLAAIQGIYDRLQIHFDMSLGESHFQPMLGPVVEDLVQRGLARESDGAICVFIPGNEAPFIIRKSDGAFTYATTDLATIRYRIDELQADAILYVVDTRQSEHFRLLFETAKLWGYSGAELKHVNFGTILGDDGKPFKTRSGDTVGLESLLNEAVVEARMIVESNLRDESGAEMSAEEIDRVAEIVGLGGIKYVDLKHNRESDYVFSWDKMLAKTGDTATYMQYAYARVCGIIRKGGGQPGAVEGGQLQLSHPAERGLMLQLLRFPEALDGAIREYRPNLLAEYLYETANTFTTFYENCPVQKAESTELRNSRLVLCGETARILKQGLQLLGISTVEVM